MVMFLSFFVEELVFVFVGGYFFEFFVSFFFGISCIGGRVIIDDGFGGFEVVDFFVFEDVFCVVVIGILGFRVWVMNYIVFKC